MTGRAFRPALAALALSIALPAQGGVVVQYRDEDGDLTTLELEGKNLRSTSQDDGDRPEIAIFDGEKRVLYSLDDEHKTYHRMDEATGAAMVKDFRAAMEQAKAEMTPEQRAEMEAAHAPKQGAGQAAPASRGGWKFERISGSEKVAGHTCEKYRMTRGGKPEGEGCFVRWGSGGLRKDDFRALEEMGRFFDRSFGAMAMGTGSQRGDDASDAWLTGFVEAAPGFPAVMEEVEEDGTRTSEMKLVKLERTTVPASRFTVPAGYREKPIGSDDDGSADDDADMELRARTDGDGRTAAQARARPAA